MENIFPKLDVIVMQFGDHKCGRVYDELVAMGALPKPRMRTQCYITPVIRLYKDKTLYMSSAQNYMCKVTNSNFVFVITKRSLNKKYI